MPGRCERPTSWPRWRVLEINPRYSTALHWYAGFLGQNGRVEDGIEMMRRAQLVAPLSPAENMGLAFQYYLARCYEEAIERARTVLAIEPDNWGSAAVLVLALIDSGDYEAASLESGRLRTITGDRPILEILRAYAHARAGDSIPARAILENIRPDPKSALYVGMVYAALGETNDALAALQLADRSLGGPGMLRAAPAFDRIRGDPRFVRLLNARVARLTDGTR